MITLIIIHSVEGKFSFIRSNATRQTGNDCETFVFEIKLVAFTIWLKREFLVIIARAFPRSPYKLNATYPRVTGFVRELIKIFHIRQYIFGAILVFS